MKKIIIIQHFFLAYYSVKLEGCFERGGTLYYYYNNENKIGIQFIYNIKRLISNQKAHPPGLCTHRLGPCSTEY